MNWFSLRILLVLGLLISLGTAAPSLAGAAGKSSPAAIKTEEWAGHSFTFLALPADKQSAGYEIFTLEQADQGFQGDRSVRIPYAGHVGEQVTITEVVPFAAGDNQLEYMVHMVVNTTGEKLIGRTMRGQLEGLVLTADLASARKQFLGKTIYPKFRELRGLYIPESTMGSVSVVTPIGGPATVVDVYTGNQSQEPIWLVVSVNGEKGILPIAYSWTNFSPNTWEETPPWQDALFMEDPKASLGWSQDLWKQIENGIVVEGMTKGQVRLSWGKPVRIEENDSIWIYGSKKLSFSQEVLSSIKTLEESR